MAEIQKRLLTVKEAAEYLGIKPRTLYNRIYPKSPNPFPVKPKRIGGNGRPLFDIKEIDKYLDTL